MTTTTTTATNTEILPPASCYPPAPIEIKVTDTILGTVVTMNEWIKNELNRLQNHTRPRHCENFSELVALIEEPKLFESLRVIPARAQPPMIYNNENEQEETEDETMDETEEEVEQEEANTDTNEKRAIIPRWLCKVFIEIMKYCNRNSIQNTEPPRLLLSEFDKLRLDIKLGKKVNPTEFKSRLSQILFGKIQLTEHLVKCWRLLCEWTTSSTLLSVKWIELTMSAYITAQKLLLNEYHLLMSRQQLLVK